MPEEGWCPRWGCPAFSSPLQLPGSCRAAAVPPGLECGSGEGCRMGGLAMCLYHCSLTVTGTWLAGPRATLEIRKCLGIKVNRINGWGVADLKSWVTGSQSHWISNSEICREFSKTSRETAYPVQPSFLHQRNFSRKRTWVPVPGVQEFNLVWLATGITCFWSFLLCCFVLFFFFNKSPFAFDSPPSLFLSISVCVCACMCFFLSQWWIK